MQSDSFQHRVWQWVVACFPKSAHLNVRERNHRFLEEALELAQANACTKEEATNSWNMCSTDHQAESARRLAGWRWITAFRTPK